MTVFSKQAVYLIAFSAILVIAAVIAETHLPGKTAAAAPSVLSAPLANAETVEETVTLSPASLKTSSHGFQWFSGPGAYCGPPFHIFPPLDDTAGSVVVGYEHFYDKGAKVFGCPDGASATLRGAVWFDLSGIAGKAPPLHVSVKSALLHFKKDRECPDEGVGYAVDDWLKGASGDKLIEGDSFVNIPACAPPECVRDVTTVVNNWVRGQDHGGYPNYGFVFRGQREGDIKWGDNDSCMTRYSDFSLTVTYKYDKTPSVTYVRAPDRPIIGVNRNLVGRTNVALAANGGVASASSTLGSGFPASGANDGDRDGTNWGSGGGWADSTSAAFPDWLEIDFSGSKTISEIDVFTLQDNFNSPLKVIDGMGFSKFGLTAFEIQYDVGSTWVKVPGGGITGNKLIWTKLALSPGITTSKIRVLTKSAIDNGYSRITEVEAWGR